MHACIRKRRRHAIGDNHWKNESFEIAAPKELDTQTQWLQWGQGGGALPVCVPKIKWLAVVIKVVLNLLWPHHKLLLQQRRDLHM